MHFCRRPHPTRAFARRYPCTSAGDPTPPAPSQGDTYTLLPAAPTPTAPSQGDTYTLLPATPPRPRLRRSSPAPGKGAGSVRGDIRGAAVPGSFPPIPWHWTVGISPRGVGLTGRGNSFPLPCLLRSQNSEYLTDPVRVPCRWLPKELAGSPHRARACGAPPPPRGRGRGPCVAISGEQPCPALLRDLPVHWTVWISPRGEGPTGRGNEFPLPCL